MVITWHGEGCFKIQNGETSVLLDPPEASSGITPPRFKTDILIKSISPWPQSTDNNQADFSVIGAGEYDFKGVSIKGFSLPKESSEKFFKSVFVIKWDDITLGVLGHLSEELPTQALENMEEVDVVIGPVGGTPFVSQDAMLKLVRQINPKVFIPSFYKIDGLKRKTLDIKSFISNFNGDVLKSEEKFVFKKKDLEEIKKTKIVQLKF
ncbi:MAG: MBL fold metallo-hydrolase [Candidatus Paceibacterota bacterium]|jgi:L-ascorbate metabolism protein UlaG (beta-lactamase superfamily)